MQMLVKKAQKGDAEAFVTLIESCKSSMYRVAKGFFCSEDDIADAISDAVLSAWEHITDLRRTEFFKTWLIRILINSCNQMMRERKKCDVVEVLPETRYLEQEFSDVEFREMISSFPEDCQMILLLYYGEQFTTREIAEILGIRENTVRSKLRRTRSTLRNILVNSL